VQVLATIRLPYFLDLFKDHPEETVSAPKVGQEAHFEHLSTVPISPSSWARPLRRELV
jgi:hypothetical protein